MYERVRKLLKNLLKNIDLYMIILASIIIFILGIIGYVSSDIVGSVTLAVLGLLAGSLLRIRNISGKQLSLKDIFQFRSQLHTLEQQLADAQKLDFCALSNISLGTTMKELLVEKVKQGCHIRLVSLNPYNENLMKSVSPFASPTLNVDDHTSQIVTALNSLVRDNRLTNTNRFQVRIYDYALPHSLMIVNGNTSQGKLRIEIFMSNHMPAKSPGIYISKSNEEYWFSLFQSEFEQIWQNAKPYFERPLEN